MSAPTLAGQPGAGWDEAQCTAALAQLEQLLAQIDDSRLAIPRIVEPFHRPPNPGTFKLYAQGALSSQNGIRSLNAQWKDAGTQSIFEHTQKSLSANADLTASSEIPRHGWIEREQKTREAKKGSAADNTDESGSTLTDDDITRIVVEFGKTHPSIKLETQDVSRTLSTKFIAGAVKLKFRVSIEREANGRHKLKAECLGTTEPFLAITRCITSRPQANDLNCLLDMIAAYKTVKGTACERCGKMLDNTMLTPTARRSKVVAVANETSETVWQAFHESCLK